MRAVWLRVRSRLSASLWVVPVLAALVAIAAAEVLVRVDRGLSSRSNGWYLFGGEAESARELLSTIASSLMTFTAVVFSITILVLQLASSQFSSRVLRTFLEDWITRASMGVFIGSFVFAMDVLPNIRNESDGGAEFVPALSVFVAFALVLVAVGVFVHYIHHMAHSIRAVQVIGRVAADARATMHAHFPEAEVEAEDDDDSGWSDSRSALGESSTTIHNTNVAGLIAEVDEAALLTFAKERDVVLELVPQVGEFVPRGAVLFRVFGPASVSAEDVTDHVVLASERTPEQDPAFGFRQLVDIAERALSPGINDPTTAVQALDQLHDLLRGMARRRLPAVKRLDEAKRLRLILPRPDWDAYVSLAFDEIRVYGERSLQVRRRLRAAIDDLLSVVPPDRAPVLRRQRALIGDDAGQASSDRAAG